MERGRWVSMRAEQTNNRNPVLFTMERTRRKINRPNKLWLCPLLLSMPIDQTDQIANHPLLRGPGVCLTTTTTEQLTITWAHSNWAHLITDRPVGTDSICSPGHSVDLPIVRRCLAEHSIAQPSWARAHHRSPLWPWLVHSTRVNQSKSNWLINSRRPAAQQEQAN